MPNLPASMADSRIRSEAIIDSVNQHQYQQQPFTESSQQGGKNFELFIIMLENPLQSGITTSEL